MSSLGAKSAPINRSAGSRNSIERERSSINPPRRLPPYCFPPADRLRDIELGEVKAGVPAPRVARRNSSIKQESLPVLDRPATSKPSRAASALCFVFFFPARTQTASVWINGAKTWGASSPPPPTLCPPNPAASDNQSCTAVKWRRAQSETMADFTGRAFALEGLEKRGRGEEHVPSSSGGGKGTAWMLMTSLGCNTGALKRQEK